MSIAKLSNLIIIVIVVIFVCPFLPICYFLRTNSSCFPLNSWIFTQTLLLCTFATFRIVLLIIKISLWRYSLQCNGASTRNLIIIIIIMIIVIVILSVLLEIR